MKLFKKIGFAIVIGAMALAVGITANSIANEVNAAGDFLYTFDTSGSYSSGISDGVIPAERMSISNTGGATITASFHKNNSTTTSIFNNSAGETRLYGKDGNGGQLTFALTGSFAMKSVKVNTSTNSGYTVDGGTTITGSAVETALSDATSVVVKNVATGTNQVRITSLEIGYSSTSTPATGISILETLAVDRGSTGTLTPTFSPEGSSSTVTWTSGNESVATVANGVVTGLAQGTATIRATLPNNAYDECLVTVSIPATTSISANPSSLHMGIGALKAKTISVSSLPIGSDNSSSFDSDDTEVATVTSAGVVTGISAGTATITVTSTANPSLTLFVSVNVYANFYDMGHEGTATSDSGTALTTDDVASNSAGHLTGDASSMVYTTVTSIYPAVGKLKTGTTSVNGVLKFNLPNGNNATKVIISAVQYSSDVTTIAINGGTAQTVASGTSFSNYVFDVTASNSVEIVFAKRCYFNALSIVYSLPEFGTLASIAINNPASDLLFETGETFSSTGLTLTATDTLSRTMAVNDGFTTNYDSHVFVPGDVGTVSVTVSYTRGAVTKTTSYNITVLAAAAYYHDFVAADAVEFTYVSSSANVTSTSEYKVMSGLAWNMVYTPQAEKLVSIGNYNGITFGSGTHPFDTVQIKSGLLSIDGANKVTKVIVDISGNGSTSVGTVTVDIDGVQLSYTDNAYAGAPAGREEMVFTSATGLFGHVNIVIKGTTAGCGLYGIKVFADSNATDTGLATNFAAAVEKTDSCGVNAESNVADLRVQYNALSSTAKEALSSINIYDFANGNVTHTGTQNVSFTAAQKWALLDAKYPEIPGSNLVVDHFGTQSIYTIVIVAVTGLTVVGAFFYLKKKKEE
ncbi:MAG: Ig-like domain-containing protein [Bacilli bacterium]|jgi:uncharacterized protein YjdB